MCNFLFKLKNFKNRADILRRIEELLLSSKRLKIEQLKICSNINIQHTEDLELFLALSIAVDKSCDKNERLQHMFHFL